MYVQPLFATKFLAVNKYGCSAVSHDCTLIGFQYPIINIF